MTCTAFTVNKLLSSNSPFTSSLPVRVPQSPLQFFDLCAPVLSQVHNRVRAFLNLNALFTALPYLVSDHLPQNAQ